MTQTARLSLPFLVPGMAAKEVVHNEALIQLSALVQPILSDGPQTAPDPAAADGDVVIVAAGASGDFAGEDDKLALRENGTWYFITPFIGMTAALADNGRLWRYDANGWTEGIFDVASLTVDGIQVVGAQQPDISDPTGGGSADTKARTAISAILSTLRTHGLIAGAQ